MNDTLRAGLTSRLRGNTFSARTTATTVAAIGMSLALAACGSTSSSGGSGGSGKVDEAGLTEAKANLDAYREPPKWQGPDAPVDLSGLQGKKVVYISVSNAIPVPLSATELRALGFTLVVFPTTALRVAAFTIDAMMKELRIREDTRSWRERMWGLDELNELVRLDHYNDLDDVDRHLV